MPDMILMKCCKKFCITFLKLKQKNQCVNKITMGKIFVRHSTAFLSIIIFLLLMACVGLLVAVLKGQAYYDDSVKPTVSSHRIGFAMVTTGSVGDGSNISSTNFLSSESTYEAVKTSTETEIRKAGPWDNTRLPKHIIPLHYDLLLHPDLKDFNFTGSVNITVNVTENTNYFIMNSWTLDITETKIYEIDDAKEIPIKETFLHDYNEYFVIETENTVPTGLYKLSVNFTGPLYENLRGFYRSQYFLPAANETRYLAVTKFEPTYARRAFPCFDEPSFKATFSVSIVHQPEYIALSNMPVMETRPYRDELLVTSFQKSVPMVTYLVCAIVCDFNYTETVTSKNRTFRVYANINHVNNTKYALEFGSKVLQYYEDYFGIEYSLPKQDMIAIPYFISGAMENWGIITFRQDNLIYDPDESGAEVKQRVASVIAHEMVHMWFGNLVTMEWWDDLWLNEGFASYVEYKGIDQFHPEWNIYEQFTIQDMQIVLDSDSTMSSHPILQTINHTRTIQGAFDYISYKKGASVLRMLEFIMGSENFRKGISNYLKMYQFRNAKTEDLWRELSFVDEIIKKEAGLNISQVMKSWTQLMGYPMITVIRDLQNASHFIASQQRFLKNPQDEKLLNSLTEYAWTVPLSYVTSSGRSGIIWMHGSEPKHFEIPITKDEWVKFNVQQTGFYLVNYDEAEWQRLAELLRTNHLVLSPSDRANILYDVFHLAEAKHIKYDIFMSLMMYLKEETHLVPWKTAASYLSYIRIQLHNTDLNTLIKNFINHVTEPLYNKLGWEETDEHLDNLLRSTVIDLACLVENEGCLNVVSSAFQNWTEGHEISSKYREFIYKYGMAKLGNEKYWNYTLNYMWNRVQNGDVPQKLKSLLKGLAHVQIPSLIHRYLYYALNGTYFEKYDIFPILRFLSENPVARPLIWNFFRAKFETLVEMYSLNSTRLGEAVKTITNHFNTAQQLREVKEFYKMYPDEGPGNEFRQKALETIRNNIEWLKVHMEYIKNWLLIEGPTPWIYYRLPSHIVPIHYDLTIHPMITENRFSGKVSIEIQVNEPSRYIIVHARSLNITKTKLFDVNSHFVSLKNEFKYEENDYFVIQPAEKLSVGSYQIYFEFEGSLSDFPKGIFKGPYIDPTTNDKKFIIATQFEPASARMAFPCFDEPFFKSTFTVRLVHNQTHTALSNTMELETIDLENGLQETRFEKSVLMPSYLVCFIIGELKYKELYTESGIRLRVYAVPHHIEKTEYALMTGDKVLTFFEKYFNISYPLTKLDMVAVPGFGGAMENWGLVTYGDERLLVDDNESSLQDKGRVANLISHELAHQWFGNLVTMRWWNDIWLNEGFASYMSYKGVEHAEPSWDFEQEFITGNLYNALKEDRSTQSHPIVQEAYTLVEILEMFDSISYSKGSSVLRMLEKLMGDDFRIGMSAYLKKYQFGHAATKDLWNELTLASTQGLNVSSLMDMWTRQMNYPYVEVKRDDDKKSIAIQQHHFLLEPDEVDCFAPPAFSSWEIPLTYYSSESNSVKSVILNSTNGLKLDIPENKWFKFNVNFTGYYIVNYSEDDWELFAKILLRNFSTFSQADRSNLLHDAFALANFGRISYDIPLNLTHYLKHETEITPWKMIDIIFRDIKKLLEDTMALQILKEHLRSLSRHLYKKLLWNDAGSYKERLLRSIIIRIACDNGNYECLNEAGNLLMKWMEGERLSPNLRDLVYTYGMKTVGDEEAWKYMWEMYSKETSPVQQLKLLQGLASVKNKTLLKELIDYAQDESKILKGNALKVMKYISENPDGYYLILDYIYNNWTVLTERFSAKSNRLKGFVRDVFESLYTDDDLEQVKEFFLKNHIEEESKQMTSRIIESIQNNINWVEKYRPTVEAWLESNVFMPWKNLRLPTHFVPSRYLIKVDTNMTTNHFNGAVNITMNVTTPSDYIILHSDNLLISRTSCMNLLTERFYDIDEEFPFIENLFWVIRFSENIPEGLYVLVLEYSGNIQKNHGLLKTSYTDNETKEKRFLLYTQFEPTYARRMFPCFDEPSLKSKFKISVTHDEEYFVISNMPETDRVNGTDGQALTVFEESVPMSTYLVCIVVSDYPHTKTVMNNGKKLRYFAPPNRLNNTLRSLEVAAVLMEKYEKFFNIPYALPKLDFVAIPDFIVSGMENWGIILYSENYLSYDLDEKTFFLRSDKVVAHELAHQWFGNLVTMKWWNDLWLNEGFSSFAMYLYLNEFHPDVDEFSVKYKSEVMIRDACPQSHPIVQAVSNPQEISKLFDRISYTKGAAVLNMLKLIMKDDFQTGLQNYLRKYAYGNAETKDLWNELSKASKQDIDIAEIMDTWTCQMGFPLIDIERNDTCFTARQQKFSGYCDSMGENGSNFTYNYTWHIPLIYKNMETGEENSFWLKDEKATFLINASPDDCIKFNPNFSGYYIIRYNDQDYTRLIKKLIASHEDFTVIDRYNLLFDTIQLVKSDQLMFDIALDMSRYLRMEKKWTVWRLTYRSFLDHINRHLIPFSETELLWQQYLGYLTENLYENSFENETKRLDEEVRILSCKNNDKCQQAEYENLQKWTQGQNISNAWQTFKITVPINENETLWEYILERLKEANISRHDQILFARALALFEKTEIIEKTLNVTMSDKDIAPGILYETLHQLTFNQHAVPIIWKQIKTDAKKFMERFTNEIVRIVKNICNAFKTMKDLGDVINFFKTDTEIKSEIKGKCLSRIQRNIDWITKYEEAIGNWLRWNVQN